MAYIINPSEWEQDGMECFTYFDESLSMRVILERQKPNENSRVWERYYYADAWTLKADSYTDFDSNNCFFYDALSKEYSNPAVLQVACKAFFFSENDALKPVELPEWLIDRMSFCQEQDELAFDNMTAWACEHKGETFDTYEQMLHSAWAWYAQHYVNGGQYSDGAEDMIYTGKQNGFISSCSDGSYTIEEV